MWYLVFLLLLCSLDVNDKIFQNKEFTTSSWAYVFLVKWMISWEKTHKNFESNTC